MVGPMPPPDRPDPRSATVLVTGGAGFIGSALCRYLVGKPDYRVVNLDKLTYAATQGSLDAVRDRPNYRFVKCDIADAEIIGRLLREEQVGGVIHLAAETHVDRSIQAPDAFISTNVVGTFRLLETVTAYWRELADGPRASFRFHHVSTDEVFGDVPYEGADFTKNSYRPSSPYSASKAAADHLAGAWHRTYGLPTLVSHSSNNYGPFQYPDKLVPVVLLNALTGQPIPIYGTGANVRDWLFVDDHVRALELVFARGRVGEMYGIGERQTRTNLELARTICRLLQARRPRPGGKCYEELIRFVADRPGHDRRYSVDPRKAEAELGWAPSESLETGLARTVDWYLANQGWWQGVLNRDASVPSPHG